MANVKKHVVWRYEGLNWMIRAIARTTTDTTEYNMCTKRMLHYRECDHHHFKSINRCQAAINAGEIVVCIPASGHSRDLPQDLDIQDQDLPGKCPACKGETPPSSAGSQ
jgi:hypothetical protein